MRGMGWGVRNLALCRPLSNLGLVSASQDSVFCPRNGGRRGKDRIAHAAGHDCSCLALMQMGSRRIGEGWQPAGIQVGWNQKPALSGPNPGCFPPPYCSSHIIWPPFHREVDSWASQTESGATWTQAWLPQRNETPEGQDLAADREKTLIPPSPQE